MTNWTRAHDAHIARECEGLEVQDGGKIGYRVVYKGVYEAPVAYYNKNPAAAIRAAEAWRKKVLGRTVKLEWLDDSVIAGLGDKQAGWHQWYAPCGQAAAALAQALYRATSGPEN